MANSRDVIDGDLTVRGRLTAGFMTIPNESVGNEEFDGGDPLDVTKQKHQHAIQYVQGNSGDTAATQTRVVYVAFAPGKVHTILAGVVDANVGAATIVVDLKKNNDSILSTLITLNETHPDYSQVEGTVDPAEAEYLEGDVFEIVITATAGGGTLGKGLFANMIFREGSE